MTFDIIELTEEELSKLSTVQMQLLRTAQKNKNSLRDDLEKDMSLFVKFVLTNDLKESSLIEQKRAELEAEFERQTEIIAEQLRYSLLLNTPYPDDDDLENVGYIVDYSLSYNDRYRIVRDYYLSIQDSSQRMALYAADDVAKKYLNSYYSTLFDVLSTYSK